MPEYAPVEWEDLELAEIQALAQEANRDALVDPATLAYYLDSDYALRPHLTHISNQLADVGSARCKRLMIMVPPQTGKSELAAVWFPFWWLARHPRAKLIIASYGQQLAVTRGRSIRRRVLGEGWRWQMALARGASQIAEWELASGGGIKSVGVGAGVTGFPADVAIIDDPHKSRAEADSLVFRDRVWDWYSADLLTRIAPGGPLVVIGTPWHHDDLLHRILEQEGREEDGGQWRVVKLPAFAGADDPLGREPGEPLMHPRLAEDDVEGSRAHWEAKRASSRVSDWSALYMLDPRPSEDALVTYALLRERRHLLGHPEPTRIAVAVDPSGGGRDSAGVIGGFLGADQRMYITHDRTMIGSSAQWSRAACELAAEIGADVIVAEKNYGGDMVSLAIRTAWDALARETPGDRRYQRLAPRVKLVSAKRAKRIRAEPIAQQFTEDRIRLGAYLPDVESEWATWRPSEADSPGRLDASCYLGYELLPVPGAETVVSSVAGISRDSVRGGGGPRITRPR